MAKQEKLSLKAVKNLPYRTLNRLINKARKYIKNDKTWKKVCEEYGETPDIIDYIPIKFGNVDVSAKTDHGVIILNWRLLCDGEFDKNKDYSYLIHEGSHYLQQTCGTKPTQSADDGDYLKNPYEVEGFQNQVEYIANHEGEKEAENYVDDLLDHHDKDGKEADNIKDVLLEKVEAKFTMDYFNTKYGD
jgi:uncharacterized protein YxeA